MTGSIKVLDCTLRDGGHLTKGRFGREVIEKVIQRLVEADVDIVEIGFLWDERTDDDVARFASIDEVRSLLPKEKRHTQFSLMADYIDLSDLEPCDGSIDIIRLSFKRHRLDWALDTAKRVIGKGYKCFLNPVNCNVYSDEEYIRVLDKINEIKPYGFSIVDTFGVLRKRDLIRIYNLVERHLSQEIAIGLHLHENLGLSYALAQHFIEMRHPLRDIVIDSSLLGMGREPGNLSTELMLDHLKAEYDAPYRIEPALDAIDDYIAPLKKTIGWGYAIPYALSARYGLHRTYAEHLMGKGRLTTTDIQRILAQVESSKAELFDEAYIEELYKDYLDVQVDDEALLVKLKSIFDAYGSLLVIAPGLSIKEERAKIDEAIDCKSPLVIGINFIPEDCKTDFVFCTNLKRLSLFPEDANTELIATSNLTQRLDGLEESVSYNRLVYHDEVFCDDSTLMFLNLLAQLEYKGEVMIAGFDGFREGATNFVNETLERTHGAGSENEVVKKILKRSYTNLDITHITHSLHDDPRAEDALLCRCMGKVESEGGCVYGEKGD